MVEIIIKFKEEGMDESRLSLRAPIATIPIAVQSKIGKFFSEIANDLRAEIEQIKEVAC